MNTFLGERYSVFRNIQDLTTFYSKKASAQLSSVSVGPPAGGRAEAVLVLDTTEAHPASCLIFPHLGDNITLLLSPA